MQPKLNSTTKHALLCCVKVSKSKCQTMENDAWSQKVREKFGSFIFISYFCPRLMQVAQLVWASEPIVFGSAFVSIYGKAFISLCFWLSEIWKISCVCRNLATVDAHVVFINDFMHVTQTYIGLLLCVIDDYINSIAWVLRCLFNKHGYSRTSESGAGKCQVPRISH